MRSLRILSIVALGVVAVLAVTRGPFIVAALLPDGVGLWLYVAMLIGLVVVSGSAAWGAFCVYRVASGAGDFKPRPLQSGEGPWRQGTTPTYGQFLDMGVDKEIARMMTASAGRQWAEGILAVFGCYALFGFFILRSGWFGSTPSEGEALFVVMVVWPLAAVVATWHFLDSALQAHPIESMMIVLVLAICFVAWQVEHLRSELRQLRSELRNAKQSMSRNLMSRHDGSQRRTDARRNLFGEADGGPSFRDPAE